MKNINTTIFIKRLSKRAKLDLPQTRLLVKIMHEQITRDLAEGKTVRLKGIGILHRVNYANVHEYDSSGKRIIHVHPEQFHICFSASRRLKRLMQAAYGTTTQTVGQATPRKPRKHEIIRQQAAEKVPITIISPPQPTANPLPAATDDSETIPIQHSHQRSSTAETVQSPPVTQAPSEDEPVPIKIKVKPKLSSISWRTHPDKQYLSIGLSHPSPARRMLATLLRQLGQKWQAVTITPQQVVADNGLITQTLSISNIGIAMIFDALKDIGFDVANHHYHTKIKFGSHPTKVVDLISGYTHQEMPFVRITSPITDTDISVTIRRSPLSQLISHAAKDNRRIAILGSKQSRPSNLRSIQKILADMNLNYHRVGNNNEEHDINIGQHLKKLQQHYFYHPITIIENLSGADDWYYLQHISSGIIAFLPFTDKLDVDRIIELQQLPQDIFNTIVRSVIITTSCPECQPIMASAVKFPALRRIASQRNELLHVHPIRINRHCNHPKKYLQLYEEYTDGQLVGASIIDQMYDLLLKHEIDWPTFAQYCPN